MKMWIRILLYLFGLFLITIGINLSIISALGISPVSAFTYPLSEASQISLGTITVSTYTILVLIQWILLKDQFKKKDLLQIPFSICFGFFVDFTGHMLQFLQPDAYISRLFVMLIGVVICAIGATIYITMDIVPNAPEGFNLAVAQRFQLSFSKSKILSDCMFISVGAIISLVSFGGIIAIREGTLISAILTGKLIGMFSKKMEPMLKKLAFEEMIMEERLA
ncbi:YczE/YyaS/YitT family protein [[Eubacterium] hominis]|uniref:YczE/YyaS/YitT family protein n=1 Tax=[Eubacterium] hominis TaxID=2764325 RepID=UPI003A4DCC67